MVSGIVLNFILVIYSNVSQLTYQFSYWTPGHGQKGPIYEQVLPVLLSGSFLGIGCLVFSRTQNGLRGPCGIVLDRAGFF